MLKSKYKIIQIIILMFNMENNDISVIIRLFV